MEFLKKNWSKLTIAVVALVGVILMIIPIFMASKIEFIGACQTIGIILFFVGTAVYYLLKMGEHAKSAAKYVLLATGILVLVFMGIGLTGFKSDKDKAQGALGNAYAYFASVKCDIENGQEQIAGLTQLAAGFKQAATTYATFSLGTFKTLSDDTAALAEGLISSGLATEDTTVGEAAIISATAVGLAQSQLPADIDATEKDAHAGAMTVLYSYVSMMLAFGLVPVIRGAKKMACSEAK